MVIFELIFVDSVLIVVFEWIFADGGFGSYFHSFFQ